MGPEPSDPVVYETVIVQPGQSLWQIAADAAPNVDPRSTIARIVDLNGLTSAGDVRGGQQITVPAVP